MIDINLLNIIIDICYKSDGYLMNVYQNDQYFIKLQSNRYLIKMSTETIDINKIV